MRFQYAELRVPMGDPQLAGRLNAAPRARHAVHARARRGFRDSDRERIATLLSGLPGQALAYKMGSREIWKLRAQYQKQLGPQFDLRRFHDCFLSSGSMPLDLYSKNH